MENHQQMRKKLLLGVFLIATGNVAAAAADSIFSLPSNMSFSFFGTAGYSISDKPYAYYYGTISERGSFYADSNVGAQLDWQISPRLSFTLQGEVAPVRDRDHHWRSHLTWAHLTFRLTNNWALKIGRSRVPALLYTQNSNVGMSYFASRLPFEVYDLSPTFEYDGIATSYTWDVGDDGMHTVSWNAYAGISHFDQRMWFRDSLGNINAGANSFSRKLNAAGTFLSYEDAVENNLLRAGLHYVELKDRQGDVFLKRHNVLVLPNGAEVYPPTGTENTDKVKYTVLALMADWHVGGGLYLASEIGIRRALNVNTGLDSRAFYLHARRRFGDFTPYVAWSYSQSNSESRRTFKNLSKPTGFAQFDLINRVSGDALLMTDQQTLAIGTAYDIGTNQRLKMQYARTRIGRGDYLVDRRLSDGDLDGEHINIFTASYNFLF